MSPAEMKTPGVYIVEKNAFPNSVVQVATGIPVFIGYTETAARGDQNLQNMPTRISSMADYHGIFGAGPNTIVEADKDTGALGFISGTRYLMYQGLRLFSIMAAVHVGLFRSADIETMQSPPPL